MNKFSFFCFLIFITNCNQAALTDHDLFEGKDILVIGGTGYLGRAIVTEVLKFNPKTVRIFSRDEVKHFNCLNIFGDNPKIKYIIGDIRDLTSVLQATKGVDIVFHVAALKRMDALESNVEEAIKTNVIGSLNVFHACIENNVDRVLFMSTDKSCLPINTYGATKFLSEKIFTNYDKSLIKTKFVVTRMGNILQSTGSVIPIFTNKIQSGQDIPLTDSRMTRFIVDKQEAAELLFDALRYCSGGEIFVKCLPALKIIDLIEILKEKYHAHNQVKLIGLRPGEKIHEVLINEPEIERTYQFKNYFIIRPSVTNIYNSEQDEPIYIEKGKQVDRKVMGEYSSGQAVISKSSLEELFKKLSLI